MQRSLCLLTLATLSAVPCVAGAQTRSAAPAAGATRDTQLEEVVVYGTAGNGETIGTPSSPPVSGEDIERRQAGSVTDVLRDNPAVITTHRDYMPRALPNIRGFGGTQHMANDPSVKVTLDGVSTENSRVYQNAGAMPVDPALLRSLQVLTGPLASLEYGSGVAGGTLAMETINASDMTGGTPGFRFRQGLSASSNGQGGMTSSTLAFQGDQRFEVLLNFTRRLQDEQKDGDGNLIGLPGFNLPSWLAKARLRLDDDNSLTFSLTESSNAERDVPYGQTTGSAVFGNVNRDTRGRIAALSWNHNPRGNDLIDLELKISRSQQDVAITPLMGPGANAGVTFAGIYDVRTDRVSLKNTARFRSGAVSHVLRAGIEWSDLSRETWGWPSRANRVMTPGYGYNPAGSDRRLALFAINNMDFGNEFRMSLGARLEHQKISGSRLAGAESYGPFSNTARTLGLGIEKGFGGGVTGFASATWGETPATLDVFHFRSPTRGGAFYGEGVQSSRNLEAGLKYAGADLFTGGDRLTGQASVWRTDIRNALFGPATGGAAEYPAYKMQGVEVSARYQRADGIFLRAGLSHADHKEKHYPNSTGWRDYTYNPGTQLRLAAGKTWSNGLTASWEMQAARGQEIVQGASRTRHPGWGVSDLSLSYTAPSGSLAGATLSLGVGNVFDKTYKQPMAYLNEPGRTFKISLSKTF